MEKGTASAKLIFQKGNKFIRKTTLLYYQHLQSHKGTLNISSLSLKSFFTKHEKSQETLI
jgi:hypothetical protein